MEEYTNEYDKPVERHKFFFQYVSTKTSDTPGTVILLHFDNRRYLFGRIGEGTQRAVVERGVSLAKARSLFLTGETRWEHNGGLLGMILTMADVIGATPDADQKALGDVHIHGGPKIMHSIACARRFIFRTSTPVKVVETRDDQWTISEHGDFRDENIRVWAVPVRKSPSRPTSPSRPARVQDESTSINEQQVLRQQTVHNMFQSHWRKDRLYETPFCEVNLPAVVWLRDSLTKELSSTHCNSMSDAPHIKPEQIVLVRLPWPASTVSTLPSAQNLSPTTSMCYIVKGRPQRGVFQPDKAKAAGVPRGPKFTDLTAGRPVTLEDGRIVRPEDVMTPPEPGQGLAVLDVPEEQYLPDLRQKLHTLAAAKVLDHVSAFTWTLGARIAESRAFQDLIAEYPHVKHIIASDGSSSDSYVMRDSAAAAVRLSLLRPESFTVPRSEPVSVDGLLDFESNIVRAAQGLKISVAPKFNIDSSEIPEDLDLSLSAARVSDAVRKLVPSSTPPAQSQTEFDDISIVTLGTGSAQPSKYRNVSANLVTIPSLGHFLLDAGENTLGQLRRLYTPQELEDILCNLHMIWISHLHADHHLGTMSVLLAYSAAVQKRKASGRTDFKQLYVISEPDMANYLHEFSSVQRTEAVYLRYLGTELEDIRRKKVSLQKTSLPLQSLEACKVSHCRHAQAVTLTFSNGFKLSYSGDCRPSAKFAEMGKDSHVLIHEATFDDGLEGDAQAKKHSTIGEALGVAQAMKAKNVILTHFSQRYQKMPTLSHVKIPEQQSNANPGTLAQEDEQDEDDADDDLLETPATASAGEVKAKENPVAQDAVASLQDAARSMSVCVAFDGMRVTIPQIKDMYKYFPALQALFEEDEARGVANRAAARQIHQDLHEAKTKKNKKKQFDAAKALNSTKEKQQDTSSPKSKRPKLDDTARQSHLQNGPSET